ncbi:MAG TPA: hypothetical protein VIE68_05245 [Gemmatimonadota bacterium]
MTRIPPRLRGLVAVAGLGLALACDSGAGGPIGPGEPEGPVVIRGRIDELSFEAQLLQPAWDRLVGRVTLTNPTAAPIALRFPDTCVVLFRLYDLSDERLVIDAHSKRCLPFPVDVPLDPGESQTFETNVTFFFILGNSLPEARYHATLYLRPEGREEVEIAVGRPRLFRPDDEML